jgi:dihydroorotase-like cyclic amidohydrolase
VSLLFRGGQVVTPEGVAPLDLRVLDGRITEVGPSLALGSERVIDVGGLVVLPGAIDPHGHQWEPGFTPAPDFSEVTASAAFGGVTTFLDHPLTPPTVVDGSGFRAKVALGERTALIDFGLHGGAAPDRLDDLGEMWQAGATGIKLFTCPTGTALDGLDDPYRLRATLERIAAIGGLALVHAEDAGALDRSRADLEAVGRGGVQDFDAWHSLEAELTAVDAVLRIASLFGTPTYIVHASSPLVVDRVIAARSDGLSAWVETCPHYLHLTDADLREQGGWAMTAPPVRDASARRDLRALVAKGAVDTVGGDHCAIDKPGKSGSRMESITPGVPSIDIYIPLLLDLVADGSLDSSGSRESRPLAQHGSSACRRRDRSMSGRTRTSPSSTRRRRQECARADLPCSAGWSPYEGRILRGAVIETWSRGERIVREGRIEGRPGRGRFIHRSEAIDA